MEYATDVVVNEIRNVTVLTRHIRWETLAYSLQTQTWARALGPASSAISKHALVLANQLEALPQTFGFPRTAYALKPSIGWISHLRET